MGRFAPIQVAIFASTAVLVTGCFYAPSSIRELQASPKSFYRTYEVNSSLAEINKVLHRWSSECSPHPGLEMDPENASKARLIHAQPTPDGTKVYRLMQFVEEPPGTTVINTYVWRNVPMETRSIRDTMAVINGSMECSHWLMPAGLSAPSASSNVVVVP